MRYQHHLQEPIFTIHNIDTISVTRNRGYHHSHRQGRDKYGFIYVVKGALTERFFDESAEEICVRTGEVLFVPKGARYVGIYEEDATEVKIVQFDLLSGVLPEYLSSPRKMEFSGLIQHIEVFFDPAENYAPKHPFFYLSCMYNLLYQIDEAFFHIPTKYKKLTPALSELSEQYHLNRPIAYYAELCEMSEVNFRRIFREYMKMSPVEYRNDLRLLHAKAKLQSGEYNVTEVAEACGFSNLSFFIRLYKRKYAHTPKST